MSYSPNLSKKRAHLRTCLLIPNDGTLLLVHHYSGFWAFLSFGAQVVLPPHYEVGHGCMSDLLWSMKCERTSWVSLPSGSILDSTHHSLYSLFSHPGKPWSQGAETAASQDGVDLL